MYIVEFIVKCPICYSETRLVSEQANPIIFYCHGCNRNVVIHNNKIYTVSQKFLRRLVSRFKSKVCGKIVASRVSPTAQRDGINTDNIQELQKLLDQQMDVRDFIDKIK